MKKIIEFQSKNGLVPDGIIGKATMNKMKQLFMIDNNIHLAHFLGQLHHETGFNRDTENLNYTPKRLLEIFPKYFIRSNANEYGGNSEAIANRVYANRMGNSNEQSGDGWKYRGRGAIQLTGKSNYIALQKWLNLRELNPDEVATKYYWHTALFFFETNRIWHLCIDFSDASITKVSKKINGGTNGLADRIAKTKYYFNLFNK